MASPGVDLGGGPRVADPGVDLGGGPRVADPGWRALVWTWVADPGWRALVWTWVADSGGPSGETKKRVCVSCSRVVLPSVKRQFFCF